MAAISTSVHTESRRKLLPQIVEARDLSLYSRCPRRVGYVQSMDEAKKEQYWKTDQPQLDLFRRIVKGAHTRVLKSTLTSPWREVTNQVDGWLFSDMPSRADPNYDAITDIKLKTSLRLIRKLQQVWYQPIFSEEYHLLGLADVPLSTKLGEGYLYGMAELILYNSEELVLCTFKEQNGFRHLLYNDMEMRVQSLLLHEVLGRIPTRLRVYSWPRDTENISVEDIWIHEPQRYLSSTQGTVAHLLEGMRKGIYYPSVSEQCNTCPFSSICSFDE